MTLRELVHALIGRWPIVLAGVVCTGLLSYAAIADRHVYVTQSEVVFLAPSSRLNPNTLNTPSEDLIITAGVVAKKVIGSANQTKYAAPEANLVGIGIREGWSVRLPDTGGQWAPHFNRQVLMLEVVGADRAAVETRRQELIDRIAFELDALQRQADVDPANDVTVIVTPESAVTYEIGGSKARAIAMVGLLGAGATLSLIVFLEYRARKRSTQSSPDPLEHAKY